MANNGNSGVSAPKELSIPVKRAVEGALKAAAITIAECLNSNGVPVMENFVAVCKAELYKLMDAYSPTVASVLNMTELSRFPEMYSHFLGQIKGQCAEHGMKSRETYALSVLIKTMTAEEKTLSIEAAQVPALKLAQGFTNRVSATIAAYLLQFGIKRDDVVEVFSGYEATFSLQIKEAITEVVDKVVAHYVDGSEEEQ
jgi:hypothetical protein